MKDYQPKDPILGEGEGIKGGWEGGGATYGGGMWLPTFYSLLLTSDYDNDDEISKEDLNILISIHSFYIIQCDIEWQTHRVPIMG